MNITDIKQIKVKVTITKDSYGNYLFTGNIYINKKKQIKIPKQYGYGIQFECVAYTILKNYLGIKSDLIYWRFYNENNIKYITQIKDKTFFVL